MSFAAAFGIDALCFTIAIIGGPAAYYAVNGVAGIPGSYPGPGGRRDGDPDRRGLAPVFNHVSRYAGAHDLFGAAGRMLPHSAGLATRDHGSVAQIALAAARLHLPIWLAAMWIGSTAAIVALMFQSRAKTRM